MAKARLAPEDRRYVIWHEGGEIPKVIHPTWAGASKEASRLAHFNRGERFHIMQTASIRTKPAADVTADAPPSGPNP